MKLMMGQAVFPTDMRVSGMLLPALVDVPGAECCCRYERGLMLRDHGAV
jgi:hypothetical protein